jgi:hypothetical protein
LPSVSALYDEFKGRGFEVRLISFREDPALVRKTVDELGYMIPVLLDTSGDVSGRVYGVFGPPTMYFVDRQGRLIGRATGARDWAAPAAKAFVRALLEAPAK